MTATRGFLVGFIIAAGTAALYGEALLSRLTPPPAGSPVTGQAMDAGTTTSDSPATTTIPVMQEEAASADSDDPVGTPPPVAIVEPESDIQQRWTTIRQRAGSLQARGDFPWRSCFKRAAASTDLPEPLLLAVARGESNFDPTARSASGAIGLMQIRWPETARHLGLRRERELYDPCANVNAGARYLKELADQYEDDWHLVLAAYNYGPSRVRPGDVPDGASWYSEYIYQHLQAVLGEDPPVLPQPPGQSIAGAGRQQLVSFSQPRRAEAFLSYLQGELPDLALTWTREPLGAHTVYLLYDSEEERRLGLQAIAANGVVVPGLGLQQTLSF